MFDFISVSDAIKLSYEAKGRLIDVRPEQSYREGHLPMAENVQLDDIISGAFHPEQSQPVFLYCDTGTSSLLAARKLDEEGFIAYSVADGIQHYKGYLEKEENELWTMVLIQ